jgi:hypothetical protein
MEQVSSKTAMLFAQQIKQKEGGITQGRAW